MVPGLRNPNRARACEIYKEHGGNITDREIAKLLGEDEKVFAVWKRLWQIHVSGESNTRTTAVFFIKYLCTLGFDVTNDIFAENAWYF